MQLTKFAVFRTGCRCVDLKGIWPDTLAASGIVLPISTRHTPRRPSDREYGGQMRKVFANRLRLTALANFTMSSLWISAQSIVAILKVLIVRSTCSLVAPIVPFSLAYRSMASARVKRSAFNRSRSVDFDLAKSSPRFRLALSIKSLGLPDNYTAAFFSEDLRGITKRSVFSVSRGDGAHRHNIPFSVRHRCA